MIDSHHHFWLYDPVRYGWISDQMSAIKRDFLPEHLMTEVTGLDVSGVISVQAEQTLAETERLLSYADQYEFIRGVVGWVPLANPDLSRMLPTVANHPRLKGLRHVVQDEPAGFMLRPDFNRGIASLKPYNLAYDILIYERQLPEAIELVDRHPEQRFVLDHLGKPEVRSQSFSSWENHIRDLAKRPHVFCKLSGLVTEADHRTWTEEQLKPYLDTVLDCFGPRRLLFGSDWPVCLLAASYARWVEVVRNFASQLSGTEQEWVFQRTAREAYRL